MHIDQIQVGFRYRKDLGDLRTLAQSIADVGLLHPVVVTPEGRLIAGQRRLGACRLLGWTEVPVTVVDLYQAARGEAHENFVRKDLLPSEIVALKRAIEPLERREARERQGSRADLCHPATVAECQRAYPGDTRDNIARYLGVGRTTIERAEAVVEAAEEEPEEYGYLVEQMDRSGKVAGAHVQKSQHTIHTQLDSFIAFRNECAHNGIPQTFPTANQVIGYCDLIEEVADGIVSVLSAQTI